MPIEKSSYERACAAGKLASVRGTEVICDKQPRLLEATGKIACHGSSRLICPSLSTHRRSAKRAASPSRTGQSWSDARKSGATPGRCSVSMCPAQRASPGRTCGQVWPSGWPTGSSVIGPARLVESSRPGRGDPSFSRFPPRPSLSPGTSWRPPFSAQSAVSGSANSVCWPSRGHLHRYCADLSSPNGIRSRRPG